MGIHGCSDVMAKEKSDFTIILLQNHIDIVITQNDTDNNKSQWYLINDNIWLCANGLKNKKKQNNNNNNKIIIVKVTMYQCHMNLKNTHQTEMAKMKQTQQMAFFCIITKLHHTLTVACVFYLACLSAYVMTQY